MTLMTFAASPPEHRGVPRDGVRLLVARTPDDLRHRAFRDLADELSPGDLVVVNTSATVNGEADASSTSRGAVVVHVAVRLDDGTWVVELRTSPDAARAVLDAVPGETLVLDGATLTLQEPYGVSTSSTSEPEVDQRAGGRPASRSSNGVPRVRRRQRARR